MIYNNLKIFSQNVCKNTLIVNTILETHSYFNIIFIQELLWSIIHSIIQILMDSPFCSPQYRHSSSLISFIDWQKSKIKSYLVDSNNRAYGTFSLFSSLHPELSPGVRIIDIFSDHFSFNYSNKKNEKNDKQCFHQLDSMVIESSLSQSIAIIATDASIKNNICISQINHSSKHYIMWLLSLVQKLSCLLSDVVLTKLLPRRTFPKSQLSLTPSTWLKNLLIPYLIHFKFILWPFLRNSIISFPETQATQQSSGKVLAVSTSIFTRQLIVNQSLLIPYLSFHAKHLGTSAGNLNVTTFFIIGK